MAFSETFTNTDTTPLPTHSAVWVTPTGGTALYIIDDAAGCSNNTVGFNTNYYNATFANAHYVTVTPTAGYFEYAGGAVRMQSGARSCFYCIKRNDGVVFAGELIAGSPTDWDAGTAGFGTSDRYGLQIDPATPTTVYLTKNEVAVKTFTGKNALSGGRAGIVGVNSQAVGQISLWQAGDVVSASTSLPPIPRRYAHHFMH